MSRPAIAALLVLAATACQKAETAEQTATRMQAEGDAAKTAIAAAHTKWSRYFGTAHADSMAALYTADAHAMGSDQPTAVGRAAIAQIFAPMSRMGAWTIRLTTDKVWANGPLVVERGTYRASLRPGPGMPRGMDTVETGKFMLRWVKEGDTWLIADDMHVADKSMMTPAQMAEMMKRH